MMNYPVKVNALPENLGGGFQALIPQFGRGVVGYGETHTEAVADLMSVLPDFLEDLKELGQQVPEPKIARPVEEFSGKFNVRIPRLLHAELVDLADDNDVSLNQMVTMLLTNALAVAKAGRMMDVLEPLPAPAPGRQVKWEMEPAEGSFIIDAVSMFTREKTRDQWQEVEAEA